MNLNKMFSGNLILYCERLANFSFEALSTELKKKIEKEKCSQNNWWHIAIVQFNWFFSTTIAITLVNYLIFAKWCKHFSDHSSCFDKMNNEYENFVLFKFQDSMNEKSILIRHINELQQENSFLRLFLHIKTRKLQKKWMPNS